ncbi:MAG: M48 family metallopeptidase [Endozoicomonadaceae bacterium]|nr:M48 family metallopeptidase [Endozoicomonadaceae bacterium]
MTKQSVASRVGSADRVTSSEHGSLVYGNDTIKYLIIRTDYNGDNPAKAASRKIRIKVHPDQRVVANAPRDASNTAINDAVLKRARWIWQSVQTFASQQDFILSKQYISGETQFYLGRRYVLKIHVDNEKAASVKLSRGLLNVHPCQCSSLPKEKRKSKLKALIEDWYLYRAKTIFHQRLNEMLPKATWVKSIPPFRLMTMKKQWGSCSAKGALMLNPHLIKAPKECIDYVILHELCHIAEHNHSERFWRLLTQVMPNWKAVKLELDGMAELYLNE